MKRLFALLFILAMASEAHAQLQQNPTAVYGQTVTLTTASTAGLVQSVITSGITAYQFTCYPIDTVTTAGVTLQTSEDGSTWTTSIASVDCSNPNQSAVTTASGNFVRINATTFSATGSVRVTWRGFVGSGDTTSVVTELESVVSELETANANLDQIETAVEDTTAIGVLPQATNTGGQTIWGLTTTASVNTSTVTSAATGVYTIWAFNPTETEAFIHFHNDGTPDCDESSTNVFIMGVPPSPAAGQQGGFLIPLTIPITGNFTTAVGICVKGDADASSDTTAPAGILVGIGYKIAS